MAYYTLIRGVGLTNLAQTFTHNLSRNPASLVARPIIRQAVVTGTAPVQICTLGTNVLTAASGVGTLVTCDIEVQYVQGLDL